MCDFLNCWQIMQTDLTFTGPHAWETSKNEFSNSECPNMGIVKAKTSLHCTFYCRATIGCTAFNYETKFNNDNSSTSWARKWEKMGPYAYSKLEPTSCILRNCTLPVTPPAQNINENYDGYWKSPSTRGRAGIKIAKQ